MLILYLKFVFIILVIAFISMFALEINREVRHQRLKVALLKDRIYREAVEMNKVQSGFIRRTNTAGNKFSI